MCSLLFPEGLAFEKAAALPLVLTTGSQLIERAVKPQRGQTVLVTGALGGVAEPRFTLRVNTASGYWRACAAAKKTRQQSCRPMG